jgi:hypothetical protein
MAGDVTKLICCADSQPVVAPATLAHHIAVPSGCASVLAAGWQLRGVLQGAPCAAWCTCVVAGSTATHIYSLSVICMGIGALLYKWY